MRLIAYCNTFLMTLVIPTLRCSFRVPSLHFYINMKMKKLQAMGFVPLDNLRAAADVVVTKPGGLSTTELAGRNLPMVIVNEYASAEALPNVSAFEAQGLAIVNYDLNQVGRDVLELIQDPSQLEQMRQAGHKFKQTLRPELVNAYFQSHFQMSPRSCEQIFLDGAK